jgi:CheY-like chemotaxis protein
MANLLLIHPFSDDLMSLKDILKNAGYQVTIAEDQDQAFSLVEQFHPQLIICVQKHREN